MAVADFLTSTRIVPFLSGVFMTVNFIIFWAIPVIGMGQIYRNALKPILQPMYLYLENHRLLRSFAAQFIYTKAQHADFFALSLLAVLNCSVSIPFVFYWQLKFGYLPLWLVFAYYCSWVGVGGSIMGAAYALAHKEGHNPRMYNKTFHAIFGNVFENGLGMFFGNVPWNFTTSHIKIHHATNGSFGDTFYLWDFDRTDPCNFMLYVHRVLLHMVGYSSIRYFECNGRADKAQQLRRGVYTYLLTGAAVLAVTRSVTFFFWIFLQPMLCMTYFLALINIGFHGFLEFDAQGCHVSAVDSTAIVEGTDDVFGEDDHMAHHYATGVYYRDLPAHQASKVEEFQRTRASVFRQLSIAELSIFIILGLWDILAEKYVDYSGQMTKAEIIEMLKTRARRVESSYEEYCVYLHNPTHENRLKLKERVPFHAQQQFQPLREKAPTDTASDSDSDAAH